MTKELPRLSLVLGGASSGKSSYAEAQVKASGLTRHYIATAQAFDPEMKQKIADHKVQRGPDWITHEVPFDLAETLTGFTQDDVVLLDCLTLWLTNIVLAEKNVEAETTKLLRAFEQCRASVIVVSNEVGQGIVPDNALSRRFRVAQGQLNRDVAAQADCVVAVMAGLPLNLKGQLA